MWWMIFTVRPPNFAGCVNEGKTGPNTKPYMCCPKDVQGSLGWFGPRFLGFATSTRFPAISLSPLHTAGHHVHRSSMELGHATIVQLGQFLLLRAIATQVVADHLATGRVRGSAMGRTGTFDRHLSRC